LKKREKRGDGLKSEADSLCMEGGKKTFEESWGGLLKEPSEKRNCKLSKYSEDRGE